MCDDPLLQILQVGAKHTQYLPALLRAHDSQEHMLHSQILMAVLFGVPHRLFKYIVECYTYHLLILFTHPLPSLPEEGIRSVWQAA